MNIYESILRKALKEADFIVFRDFFLTWKNNSN